MPRLGVVLTCFETTGTTGATTGTSIGDVKAGGSFTVDPGILSDISIDGVTLHQGGLVKTTFEVELNRPVKAYITAMLRASASTTVTSKSFQVGTEGGRVCVSGCQPSGFTYGGGVDQIPRCRVGYWGLRPVETASGSTSQPANTTGSVTDGWSNLDALLGTAAGTGVNYGVQSFEIVLNTNPQWYSELSTKTSGVKRIPTAILLGQQDWTLTYDCAEKISHSVSLAVADAIEDDFYATVDGSTIDFALSGLPSPAEPWEFRGPGDLVTWRYVFRALSVWGTGIVA